MTTNSAITPESAALLERVVQVKKQYRLTFSQIAKQAGMHQPTVTNQINGKYNIDVRVLLAIAVLCPDLSCDWLLRGEGEMKADTQQRYSSLLCRVEKVEQILQSITTNY